MIDRKRGELERRHLEAVEDAVRAAYPDRADSYMAVIERWLWWSGPRDEVPLRSSRCVICTRDGVAKITLCTGRLDPWDPRVPFNVCGACLVLTCELANKPPADTEILADLKQAALEPGLLERVFTWRKDALPFTPTPDGTNCFECLASDPPVWQLPHQFKDLCESCVRGIFNEEFGFTATINPLEKRILRRQFESSDYR